MTTIRSLGINVDGINKTTGLEVEEFFYTSLSNCYQLSNLCQIK